MKYHNFKRTLAAFLAAALTVGSTAFVASAQEAATPAKIEYTLAGGSADGEGGGDYVIDVDAVGGLINIGAITVKYDRDLYSEVKFTPAENIVDASFFWGVDNKTDGEFSFAFSSDNEDDDVAGLFAEDNASGTIAYIDATNPVNIGTLTFTFADNNTYATAFTTNKAENSSVAVESAKYILHDEYAYDAVKYDAETAISNTLVFSAVDFEVSDTVKTYNGEKQAPTIAPTVTGTTYTLDLDGDTTQKDAGTYAIKVKDVSGEGYYDADEIDLGAEFVINKDEVGITAPTANPDNGKYVENGFDPKNITLSSDAWEVTDTALLDAGEHEVNVKYVGEFDTDNNIYKFNGEVVEDKSLIVAKVAFEVTKAEGEVPALTTTYEATYDSGVAQTVTGYENKIALSSGWEWVVGNAALAIGTNANIAVKFTPTADQLKNYTFEGYDAELGYVPGTVTVTLNKATGTAPDAPVVNTADQRRDSLDDVIKASDFVTDAGVWSYTDAELVTGVNTITFTYKPADQDVVDYEDLENWNKETKQFEYSETVKVLAPYLKLVVPPQPPASVPFEKDKTFTTADFDLASDWKFAENEIAITSAGTTKDVKVLYKVPAGYDVDRNVYATEEIEGALYIVSKVDLTVDKIAGTVTAPTATQSVTFNSTKADKLVTTYVTSFGDGWTIVDTTKTLAYGDNEITVQHVADTVNYTWAGYTVGEGVITTTVNVTFNKAVIETTVPPVLVDGTNNKTFIEAGYKYSDFEIATDDWYYDTPNATITEAGTVTAKVKYEIGADYKLPEDSTWTVENGYIVEEIALTVVKAKLPDDAAVATNTTVPYNRNNQTVNVSAKGGYTDLGTFTVSYKKINTAGDPVETVADAGTYDVYVTFADGKNYEGGTITLQGYLTILKADVTKDVDFTVSDTTHTYDGNVKTVTVTKVNDEIGDPNVVYAGDVINVGKYTFTVSGDATDNYNNYSFEYTDGLEITKATLKADDFAVDANDFTYDGTAKKATVSTALNGVGTITVTYKQNDVPVDEPTNAGTYDVYVTVADDGTNYNALGETKVGPYEIKKATLPTDAAIVTEKTTEYTGSGITVVVEENAKYKDKGLGVFSVAYPEGNIDVGTYDVTATFEEGENYLGGTLTFADALTITKQVLEAIETPEIDEEMFVGTVLTGNIDGTEWSYDETKIIVEYENRVTITQTIPADKAKNYDYSQIEDVTATVNTDGSVTLTKEYTITGKYATGTLKLTVNTISKQTDDKDTGDVTITIKPETGDAIVLASGDFTESGSTITVDGYVLKEGKYTITVKKQRYLAYVVEINVAADESTEKTIALVAGDIVGGPIGNEVIGDGVIDIDDFVIAIRAFDTLSSAVVKAAADIDESGLANVTDLAHIKANFNKTTAGNCTETIE